MWSKRILVAYDGFRPSQKALDIARDIARTDADVEVLIVHIVRLFSSGGAAAGIDTVILDEVETIKAELDELAAALPNAARVIILKGSSPADLILNCARDEQADLIIMGSRGKGGVKGYLGSVSYAVVKDSPVTVMIAKDAGE